MRGRSRCSRKHVCGVGVAGDVAVLQPRALLGPVAFDLQIRAGDGAVLVLPKKVPTEKMP